jgi:E3 ubiquitin-protein ligase RGLG
MNEFDDKLPQRKFDNFQFVPFHDIMARAENREVTFSINALQEIPEQFQAIRKLGLLSK